MTESSVAIVGAGIAGLTAGALLAHEGIKVILIEAHSQPGGCAGTFRRGSYVFDVGATQVAGFEKGGIHERIFSYLQWPAPVATILDPACVVDLGDGSKPISLWHNPQQWERERKEQFPGSELFWALCNQLHKNNWSFALSDPILPVKDLWDLRQTLKSIKPLTALNGLFSRLSVADLLRLCSCADDARLKQFLDLQLKLYSQETSDQTAALYGATVLHMAQSPLGLWHLDGSMQKLSDHLLASFLKDGGELLLNHQVVRLSREKNQREWTLDVINNQHSSITLKSADIICTIPPQCLLKLITDDETLPHFYRHKLKSLSQSSGAIVLYAAIDRNRLPVNLNGHIQLMLEDLGSLFISISQDGDGRAPIGMATFIASAFANVSEWSALDPPDYILKKNYILEKLLDALQVAFDIAPQDWLHKELSTPKSFARWTRRPQGIVGGVSQTPSSFGPFGLSSRTPVNGLWLCGDSIYPGEGTAGVSQSALMACRQLMAKRGRYLKLNK